VTRTAKASRGNEPRFTGQRDWIDFGNHLVWMRTKSAHSYFLIACLIVAAALADPAYAQRTSPEIRRPSITPQHERSPRPDILPEPPIPEVDQQLSIPIEPVNPSTLDRPRQPEIGPHGPGCGRDCRSRWAAGSEQ
jgi:hypothetical protein